MKKNIYITITLIITAILLQNRTSAAKIQDIDAVKDRGLSSQKALSLWFGSGLGLYFSSGDMHSYLKRNIGDDAWSTFLGISGKTCIDLRPFSWLVIQAEGEALTSTSISGSLYRKHAYNRLHAVLLPGICFNYFDAEYMLAAGPLYSLHFFKGYRARALSYRIKLSMTPFVNELSPFNTTRGFISFDYSHADDNGFELGGWGIQIGGEIQVL